MKVGIISQNDPLHAYIKLFKERLEEASNNRIEVKLFPGAQLGGESALAEGVQLGTIEMIAIPAVYLKGLDERFQVADAMGLFRDLDHAYTVLQNPEVRDPFLDVANENGIRGVSLWVYDVTSFATKTPFSSLVMFLPNKNINIGWISTKPRHLKSRFCTAHLLTAYCL